MRSNLAWIFVVVLALPAALTSLVGFYPYDDEGLFLYMAHLATAAGFEQMLPYRDYPLEYGPLFPWLLQTLFTLLPLNHYTGRLIVSVLAVLITLLIAVAARKAGCSRPVAAAAALSWCYRASPNFSESLHPGWFIALLQVLQVCLLFSAVTSPRRYTWMLLAQGLLAALVTCLKPHLGVLGALALLCYYATSANYRQVARLAILLLVALIAFLIFPTLRHQPFSVNQLVSLTPHLAAAAVILGASRALYARTQAVERSGLRLYPFVLACGGLSVAFYGIAALRYGIAALADSLVLRPGRLYYLIYSGVIPYTPFEIALLAASLIALLLLRVTTPNQQQPIGAMLRLFGLLAAVILCSSGSPRSVLGWGAVYLYALDSLRAKAAANPSEESERAGRLLALLVFAGSQLLHAFPLPATQVHYATAVGWILLYRELQLAATTLYRCMPLTRALAPLGVALLGMLVVSPVFLSGYRAITWDKDCAMPSLRGIAIESEYQRELCVLVAYLQEQSRSEETLLTIPGFFSLNLLTERASPGNLPAARWSYLPYEKVSALVAALPDTKFVVVHRENGRLYLETPESAPAQFDTRLYPAVVDDFALVPDEQWLGEPSKFFTVYRR